MPGRVSRRKVIEWGAASLGMATTALVRSGDQPKVPGAESGAELDRFAEAAEAGHVSRSSAGLPGGIGNPYRFVSAPPLRLGEQELPSLLQFQLMESLSAEQRAQLKDNQIQLVQGRPAWDGVRRVLVVDADVTPDTFPLQAGFQAAMLFNPATGLPLREAGATHELLGPARMGERLCSPSETSARYAWVLPPDREQLPPSRLLLANTSGPTSYWDPARCLIALSEQTPGDRIVADFDRCVQESRVAQPGFQRLPPYARAGDVTLPDPHLQALRSLRTQLCTDARVRERTQVVLDAATFVGGRKPAYEFRENLLVLTVRRASNLDAQLDQLEGLMYGLIGVLGQSFVEPPFPGAHSVHPLPSYPVEHLSVRPTTI